MAITFPRTWPTGITPSKCTFGPVAFVSESMSQFSGESQVQEWSGALWRADFAFPRLRRSVGAAFLAFITSLRGKRGTFLIPMFGHTTARGSRLGTPLVDGASQAGATLASKGWTPSESGVLLAGDFINLGSGSSTRLHQVLADVNADAAGKASIEIWPDLRESPSDAAAIATSGLVCHMALTENYNPWDMEPADLHLVQFSARERVNVA